MPAKRFVDIEVALRWAYRDELPKRQTGRGSWIGGTSLSAAGPMFSGAADDGAGREPGYPPALGEPHRDALAIESAVKGLAAWTGHSFGPDDPAGIMHGFDVASWRADIDHIQAALEAVAAMAGIVAVHARAGTRPKWSRALSEPFPDTGANGKPRVLIDETFVQTMDRRGRVRYEPADDPRPGEIAYREPVSCPPVRKDRYREGAYCPLVYRPVPARIVAERVEYAAWRMGLDILADELTGRLDSIAPLPAAAPWRPWAGESEQHGRPPELFKGQRDGPYRRETREQAAAKRRALQRRQLSDRGEETRPVRPRAAGRRNGDVA